MRAISLWQPHASLWCSPAKIHETRHWPTDYRGPVAVHAAKKFVKDCGPDLQRILSASFGRRWTLDLPVGALIGIVELVDCVRTEDVFPTFWFEGDPAAPDDYWCGDFSPGRFAWKRAEFRLFAKPIPFIGRQGFFQVPWCAAQAVIHGATRTAPEGPILFYGPEHYVLSNFSAFQLRWRGHTFPTSEHAYHWEKFRDSKLAESELQRMIREAPSAHEAYKLAERNKVYRRAFWDTDKVDEMRDIIRAKSQQHEYVQRKLIETGDRELIEDSWRDGYWGWGEQRNGQNMLGKLWMQIRAELREVVQP